ncbi:MAG: hypothetical protein J2P24_06480 [Streptosporangiales bacterium]|nr:hypothetical protein [Streptosporangiales bacterium]
MAWMLSAAGVPRIRLRRVPPVIRSGLPAIGSASYHVWNHGLSWTASSRLVICCGEIRSARESPDPSTIRSCDVSSPSCFISAVIAAVPALHVPTPSTSRPIVFASCSACMLLLSLRNGVSISPSVIESCDATVRAPDGVAPRASPPATRTPCRPSASANSDSTRPVGSHTVTHTSSAPAPAGMLPVTSTTFSPCLRTASEVSDEPGAPVVALFTTWT